MIFSHPQVEIISSHLGQDLRTDLNKEPGDHVRLRLLEAALKLLLCEGIHAFTQTRVADIAGVRQSHLTYYFPTRIMLLTAVVKRGSEVILNALLGESTASLPPSLEEFRQAIAAHLSNTQTRRLIMALSVASDEYPSLKVWMAEFDIQIKKRMHLAFLHYGMAIDDSHLALFHATLLGIALLNINAFKEKSEQQANQLFVIAFDRLVRNYQVF